MVSAGGVLAAALAFFAAVLAAVLTGGASVLMALAVLAVAAEADLLAEADVFVTGSSFPKCVIHRQVS